MRWPEIRAGLIVLAIAVGVLDGCPIPPKGQEPPWERSWIGPIRTARDTVNRPFQWISDGLSVSQKFALFVAPKPERYRLAISTRRGDGPWQLIYRAADPDHQAYDDVIRYRRIHGTWDVVEVPGPRYHEFVEFLAARVFADTDATAVQARFEKIYMDLGAPRDLRVFLWPEEVRRP